MKDEETQYSKHRNQTKNDCQTPTPLLHGLFAYPPPVVKVLDWIPLTTPAKGLSFELETLRTLGGTGSKELLKMN